MLSTRDRDCDCLSLCKELEFFIVKALSNLSLKIRIFARLSYRGFPAIAIAPVVTGISLEIMTFGQVRTRGGRQGAHQLADRI